MTSLSWRLAQPDDRAFEYKLYTTMPEASFAFGLDASVREQILSQQFAMREDAYRAANPQGQCWILLLDGERVGRVWVDEADDHLLLIDFAIAEAFRGRGFGAEVLRHLQQRSRDAGLPLRFHALAENVEGQRFYLRHGCVITGNDGVHVAFEYSVR